MPTQYSFPARNRIIAGLSLATLVAEAPEESGALITANCALDYNREVFAVPHPTTSFVGKGCNKLIKLGSRMIESAEDILEALNINNADLEKPKKQISFSNPTEEKIFSLLSHEPRHIDVVRRDTNLSPSVLSGAISVLEIKGIIKNVGGMNYVRNI